MGSDQRTPNITGKTLDLGIHPSESVCPTNGKVGTRVGRLTLMALLARPLTELRTIEYRFCHYADCSTVYYSADGSQVFTEADLRERVYQKHPDEDDTIVCYCFRHTVGDILLDLAGSKSVTVAASINQGIQKGQCACDIRNPQGNCCLGNVNQLVKNPPAKR